jgi:hypothetical protein
MADVASDLPGVRLANVHCTCHACDFSNKYAKHVREDMMGLSVV